MPRLLWHVGEATREASRTYTPGTFPGRITFFRATVRPAHRDPPEEAWRRVATAGVDVIDVEGAHGTIVQDPRYVPALAAKLKECLEVAQAVAEQREFGDLLREAGQAVMP